MRSIPVRIKSTLSFLRQPSHDPLSSSVLTGGRVVGRDLRKKVGVVADLFGHEAEEEVAHDLLRWLTARPSSRPSRIDARATEVDACTGPQDQKAEPATEIGEVADRPLGVVSTGSW